ncbi:MAG: IS30 family transposase [Oscillospiraceae bacterium]|nr:IS30 family transposase [Oscillospiraceae bacterium]
MSKHLSLSDRAMIERLISMDFSFAAIADKLNRSPSTISREVKRYRVFTGRVNPSCKNDCTKYHSCLRNNLCHVENGGCFTRCKLCSDCNCTLICKEYESLHCELLDKPPYVCSGCSKQKTCKKEHAYYTAHRAHSEYLHTLKTSRTGIRTSPERMAEIGDLISPLIMKGQSINHIISTHSDEIGLSEKTIYNYIDSNAFSVKNIDLPKKVTYRQRRPKKVLTKLEYKCRRGRTFDDFQSFVELHPDYDIVEMDTVKGARGSKKVLLTMIFRRSNFMLIFLMPDGTMKSVQEVFDILTEKLGLKTFRKLFKVILTDNGVEFKDPDSLEYAPNGCQRTKIFFCDPQASWQKPHIEKNHTLIRRIIPKGTSLNSLSAEDVRLVCCHINSVAREIFDNKTPFELMSDLNSLKLLDSLNLQAVPADKVILKPILIKN